MILKKIWTSWERISPSVIFEHSDPETTASGRPKATACLKEGRYLRERLACPLAFAEHLLLGNTRRELRHLTSSESLSISLASLEKFIVHVFSLPISPWPEILTKTPLNTKNLLFQLTSIFQQDNLLNACWLSLAEKAKNCSSSYLSHPWTDGVRHLITNTAEAN